MGQGGRVCSNCYDSRLTEATSDCGQDCRPSGRHGASESRSFRVSPSAVTSALSGKLHAYKLNSFGIP